MVVAECSHRILSAIRRSTRKWLCYASQITSCWHTEAGGSVTTGRTEGSGVAGMLRVRLHACGQGLPGPCCC
jgi:hypothetical protein